MSEGGYEARGHAIREARGTLPYGRFAQQAQLEVAYAYYKQG